MADRQSYSNLHYPVYCILCTLKYYLFKTSFDIMKYIYAQHHIMVRIGVATTEYQRDKLLKPRCKPCGTIRQVHLFPSGHPLTRRFLDHDDKKTYNKFWLHQLESISVAMPDLPHPTLRQCTYGFSYMVILSDVSHNVFFHRFVRTVNTAIYTCSMKKTLKHEKYRTLTFITQTCIY